MAKYRISGVWKDSNSVITHYAFHTVNEDSTVTRANKITKTKAIELLETKGNSAVTWIWNYTSAIWNIGANVEVINGSNGKFLRSIHDNKVIDNLYHLINSDWFIA